MEFCLTDNQEALSDALGRFLADECPASRPRALYDGHDTHDLRLWRQLSELGYCGLVVPEPHGGSGLGLLDAALVCERLGHAAAPFALESHLLASFAIAKCGNEQRDTWLRDIGSGGAIATVALGEAGGVWSPHGWSIDVREDRLTGTKSFVHLADVAKHFVVGCRGGALALVEAGSLKRPVQLRRTVDRSRAVFDVDFTEAKAIVLEGVNSDVINAAGLCLLSADAFGAASRLIEMCTQYALLRTQFGQPIAQFQAVKHQLADMAAAIFGTRSLWWVAAHQFDVASRDALHTAALAKSHIADQAASIGRKAVELHGAIGFTWECDVHLFFKRAYHDRLLLGTPELLRERCAQLAGWLA